MIIKITHDFHASRCNSHFSVLNLLNLPAAFDNQSPLLLLKTSRTPLSCIFLLLPCSPSNFPLLGPSHHHNLQTLALKGFITRSSFISELTSLVSKSSLRALNPVYTLPMLKFHLQPRLLPKLQAYITSPFRCLTGISNIIYL